MGWREKEKDKKYTAMKATNNEIKYIAKKFGVCINKTYDLLSSLIISYNIMLLVW
jgi:hypothetical protein